MRTVIRLAVASVTSVLVNRALVAEICTVFTRALGCATIFCCTFVRLAKAGTIALGTICSTTNTAIVHETSKTGLASIGLAIARFAVAIIALFAIAIGFWAIIVNAVGALPVGRAGGIAAVYVVAGNFAGAVLTMPVRAVVGTP